MADTIDVLGKNGEVIHAPAGPLSAEGRAYLMEHADPKDFMQKLPKFAGQNRDWRDQHIPEGPQGNGMSSGIINPFINIINSLQDWKNKNRQVGSIPEQGTHPNVVNAIDRATAATLYGVPAMLTGGLGAGAISGTMGAATPPSSPGDAVAGIGASTISGSKLEKLLGVKSGAGTIPNFLKRFLVGAGTGAGLDATSSVVNAEQPDPASMAAKGATSGLLQSLMGATSDRWGSSKRQKELTSKENVESFPYGGAIGSDGIPSNARMGAANAATQPILDAATQELNARNAQKAILNNQISIANQFKNNAAITKAELEAHMQKMGGVLNQGEQENLVQQSRFSKQQKDLKTKFDYIQKGIDPDSGRPLEDILGSQSRPNPSRPPDPSKILHSLELPALGQTRVSGSLPTVMTVPPSLKPLLPLLEEDIAKLRASGVPDEKLGAALTKIHKSGTFLADAASAFKYRWEAALENSKKYDATKLQTYEENLKKNVRNYKFKQLKQLQDQMDAAAQQKTDLEYARKLDVSKEISGVDRDASMLTAKNNMDAIKKRGAELKIDLAKNQANQSALEEDLKKLSSDPLHPNPVIANLYGPPNLNGDISRTSHITNQIWDSTPQNLKALLDAAPQHADTIRDIYIKKLMGDSFLHPQGTRVGQFDLKKMSENFDPQKFDTLYGTGASENFNKFKEAVGLFQKYNAEAEAVRNGNSPIVSKAIRFLPIATGMALEGLNLAKGGNSSHAAAAIGGGLAILPFNQPFWDYILKNADASNQLLKWAKSGASGNTIKSYPAVSALINMATGKDQDRKDAVLKTAMGVSK